MGYYSNIVFETKIRGDKVKEFRKEFKRIKREAEKQSSEKKWDGKEYILWDWNLVCLDEDNPIDNDGEFNLIDSDGKWYHTEEFAQFLMDYVMEGYIYWLGEDGEKWGYYFDGKGGVWGLEWEMKRTVKLWG